MRKIGGRDRDSLDGGIGDQIFIVEIGGGSSCLEFIASTRFWNVTDGNNFGLRQGPKHTESD